MSESLGGIHVTLRADPGPLVAGLRKAEAAIERLEREFEQVGRVLPDFARQSRQVETALARMDSRFTAVGGSLRSAAAAVAAGFSVSALTNASRAAFELATNAEETASKFETVLGPASDALAASLDGFANSAGLTLTQAKGLTATLASVAQGMDLSQRASASFANEAIRLAADLASFNNVPIEQTARAITSAVTGERESLKTLGIVISEADVKTRALADSGRRSADALTRQEKAAATLALISERAGSAVGDLGRTSDSTANRARELSAEFQESRERLATALLPAFNEAIAIGADLADTFAEIAAASGEDFGAAVAGAVRATGDLLGALGDLNQAVGGTEGDLGGLITLIEKFTQDIETAASLTARFSAQLETEAAAYRQIGVALGLVDEEVERYADTAGLATEQTDALGGAFQSLAAVDLGPLSDGLATVLATANQAAQVGKGIDFLTARFAAGETTSQQAPPEPPAPPFTPPPPPRPARTPPTPKTDPITDALKSVREAYDEATRAQDRFEGAAGSSGQTFASLAARIDIASRAMESAADVAGPRGQAAFDTYRAEVASLSEEWLALARSSSEGGAAVDASGALVARGVGVLADANERLTPAQRALNAEIAETARLLPQVKFRPLKTDADLAREAFERLGFVGEEAVFGIAQGLDRLSAAGADFGGDLLGAVFGSGPSTDEINAFTESTERAKAALREAFAEGRIGSAELSVGLDQLDERLRDFEDSGASVGRAFTTLGQSLVASFADVARAIAAATIKLAAFKALEAGLNLVGLGGFGTALGGVLGIAGNAAAAPVLAPASVAANQAAGPGAGASVRFGDPLVDVQGGVYIPAHVISTANTRATQALEASGAGLPNVGGVVSRV